MSDRWDYWNGPDEADRRIKYAKQFKPEYQINGDEVQRRVEPVLVAFVAETQIELPLGWASGWRPPAINEATSNAGKLSNHLLANAGDKRDNPDGAFAWWCFRNPHVLETHKLWMEHPAATVIRSWKTALEQKRTPTPWCHLQTLPPNSGLRCYWPDGKAAGEWEAFLKIGGQPNMTYEAWKELQGEPDGKA